MTDAFDKLSAKQSLQSAPVGVLVFSQDKEIAWVNDRFARMLHLTVDQVCELKRSTIQEAHIQAVFDCSPVVNIPAQDESGDHVLSCQCTEQNGVKICFYQDITEVVTLKAQLETLSINDPVTGVLNKRGLFRDLEPLVSRSRRYGNILSLFILSVDNVDDFKIASTDDVMLAISRLLRDEMRWADMIGRLSDNQFMIILPETGIDAACALTEKITAKIADINIEDGKQIMVHTGNAEWQRGDDVSLLMMRARNELETAQSGGQKAAG